MVRDTAVALKKIGHKILQLQNEAHHIHDIHSVIDLQALLSHIKEVLEDNGYPEGINAVLGDPDLSPGKEKE